MTASGPVSAPSTVVLINGDKVAVTGTGASMAMTLEGADGGPVPAYTTTLDGDTYVYPHSVMPYVSSGILDKSLFNVTQLLAEGYGSAHTRHIPLIVRYSDASRARAEAIPAGAADVRPLTSIQGAALAEENPAEFWDSLTDGVDTAALTRRSTPGSVAKATAPVLVGGITHIWLDRKVKADLADTVAQIGAPAIWTGGNTGEGVDVAVLDTGVDTEHPDLVGQVTATSSFVSGETVVDRHGHGTHVASTIAGTGAASAGREKGVAPGARLHVGKVLSNDGQGHMSSIVAGMEWAAREQHAKIVNMSLGTVGASDGSDPMSLAVQNLSAETGALFTVSAGNSGPDGIMGAPAVADAALTVGAVDSADTLADFSTRGPSLADAGIKPEITAPGVDVLAARTQYATGEGYYTAKSGTSMAAPHVSGAAALLAATHPDWTGQQLKDALVSTAKPTPPYTPYQAGNGRVDIAAAGSSTLFATGTVSGGLQTWPPVPGATVDREVTYTNTAATPVTVDLAVRPGSAPGLFTLSASKLTVPAHGTGKITVTAHMDAASPGKSFDGRVEAAVGGTVLAATAVGISTQTQKYKLTIKAKDRAGQPVAGDATLLWQQGQAPGIQGAATVNGDVTMLLDSGQWAFAVAVPVRGVHGPNSQGLALLTAPEFTLDHDTTLTLDASKARQVKAVTPRESVTTDMWVSYRRTFESSGTLGWSFSVWPLYDSFWALPTAKKVTDGTFTVRARWRNEQPALKLASGTEPVDDILVRRGTAPLPKGNSRLDAVYLERGTAADYAGRRVRGKAAIVLADDTVPLNEQEAAAAAAGAKVLIVVNGGAGLMDPRHETTPPLTVVSVGKDEGERLIGLATRGGATLRVFSNPTTDYLYDLAHAWDGGVPADAAYRPRPRDLARIDVAFNNYRASDAMEARWDIWVDDPVAGGGHPLPRPAQGTRTDWVSTESGMQWEQAASVTGEVRNVAARHRYEPGTVNREQWFAPISRPRLRYGGSDGTFRQDDMLFVSIPGWGDSGTHHAGWAMNPESDAATSIYQGDTLLADSHGVSGTYTYGLRPERLPYRIVAQRSRGSWAHPYSTATRTVWDFTSAAGEPNQGVALPLIQLDYAVDTDSGGRARRKADFTLTPSHLMPVFPGQSLPSSDIIRTVGLEMSYDDGVTWRRAPLKHTSSGGWRTTLDAPKTAAYATIRATARDSQGNAVTQSITRAFGLK
ncbi:S8 family peptidase [Streptomyces sp. NPDC087659]|uniref:S8 family peptidase n=1 Tax=Streptomyces sp. NPDC087659 TaxID=3365801 RepID=UPI00380D3E07